MADRFKPVWAGETQKPRRPQPAAASSTTDAESGAEQATAGQELRALQAMRDRGHLSEEDHERRRAAILARVRATNHSQ